MNRREKAAGALAVAGMCLTATDSLTAAICWERGRLSSILRRSEPT